MESDQVTEYQGTHIARKVVQSAGWSALAGYLQLLVSFFGNLVLARLLLPSEFGIYALASSILLFIFMFAGFGSQEAIIQCREKSLNGLIPTAFWITLSIAACLSIIGILLAVILNSVYDNAVAELIGALALLRLFSNIADFYSAILQRNLRFKAVAHISIFSTFISFFVAGSAAWLGAGSWALLLREAVGIIVKLLASWRVSGYHIEYQFNRRAARWIWSFGWRMMIARITEVIYGRFDNFIVGMMLGTGSLGHYTLSYRLALTAQQLTQGATQSVVFAAFSSIQHSAQKIQYGFERLNYWLWRLILPMGLIVTFVGDDLVVALYGEKWKVAGRAFQLMAIFVSILPLHESTKNFLMGTGYLSEVVRTRLIQIAIFTPLVTFAAIVGNLTTVIWAVNVSMVLSWFLMISAATKIVKVNWTYLVKAPLVAFFASILANYSLSLIFSKSNSFSSVILHVSVILAVYVSILIIVDQASLKIEFENIRVRVAH